MCKTHDIVIVFAHMWPLVTSLRLRVRAGDAKRCVVLAPGTQNDPNVGKHDRTKFSRANLRAAQI